MAKRKKKSPLDLFEERLGIKFNRRDLLEQALRHRSFINENPSEDLEDNERLEYLGDAILDFLTADMLFMRFPHMPEGEMTRLRSALVRTESLAQLAVNVDLGAVLFIGKGEDHTGGRERINNLCGAFEALIGAIYLDQGLDTVREFVLPRLTELQADVMEDAIRKDPRSQFQEWAQAIHSITPEFYLVDTDGPEHDKQFTVELRLENVAISQGQNRTKRSAAQTAARAAMDQLEAGELEDLAERLKLSRIEDTTKEPQKIDSTI